ncbi:MAG: 4Fe-4S dicluster domain-containing protein [Methanomassiliicoccales archaeon]|nr:MAG: 4Fe-4S dicluster domain-containing protein [Methanomassiliicoccales archaeon]
MRYLFTYPEKCTGCRQCAIACALNKSGECNPKKGAINVLRDEFERYEIQFVCLQCEDPECVAVCMKNAIERGEDQIIRIDPDKCIGCRMCVVACPYGAISSFEGDIIKCDLCDGEPVCIKFCSTDAVVYEEESKELVDRRKELANLILKKE